MGASEGSPFERKGFASPNLPDEVTPIRMRTNHRFIPGKPKQEKTNKAGWEATKREHSKQAPKARKENIAVVETLLVQKGTAWCCTLTTTSSVTCADVG